MIAKYMFHFAELFKKVNRFQCLRPSKFRQGELKSIITLLVGIAVPFQLFYGKPPMIAAPL